jgi:drug/metabolite transporter (DMT)-like permease
MNNTTIMPTTNTQPKRTARHEDTAEVLMLVTTFCWASNIVAGKEALQGFGPLALAQLRMSIAALFFGVLFLSWPGRPKLHFFRKQWFLLGLMGFTGITLNQICFLGGLARTSVTHTGLIQAVGPIMVLLLAAFIGRELLTFQNCAGMAIAFAGVAVLLTGKSASQNGAHWSGDVILLAAGASFAFYTILMKDVASDYDALTLSMLVFGLGAVLLVPFSLGSVAKVEWHEVPFRAWAGLAYMVVFGSVVAYLIYAFALSVLSASKAAAFAYLQPVMAVALGVWLLGERVTAGEFAGGALILFGVYLTEQVRARGRVASETKRAEMSRKAGVLTQRTAGRWSHSQKLTTALSAFGEACSSQVSILKECRRCVIPPLNVLNDALKKLATRFSRHIPVRSSPRQVHGIARHRCCSARLRVALPTGRNSHRVPFNWQVREHFDDR